MSLTSGKRLFKKGISDDPLFNLIPINGSRFISKCFFNRLKRARFGFYNFHTSLKLALHKKDMGMEIKNCLLTDAREIILLYQAARDLQTQRKMVVWPYFEKRFIENEIKEERQWKLVADNAKLIACNWAISFADKEIWGERHRNDAVYIHRICTNPALRGNRYIDKIVEWSKEYALRIGKRFVRLDTLGNNTKLIEHYRSAGINFLGMFRLTDTANLPLHYQNEPNCCLFEIDVGSATEKGSSYR